MTNSGFQFNSAPNSASSLRQFGGVAAVGLSKVFGKKGKGGGGLSHAEQSALSSQAHEQNVRESVAKQVLGEMSAESSHKRTQSAERAAQKRSMATTTHMADTVHGMSANVNLRSADLSKGSFATTHPQQRGQQMQGVGDAADLTGM